LNALRRRVAGSCKKKSEKRCSQKRSERENAGSWRQRMNSFWGRRTNAQKNDRLPVRNDKDRGNRTCLKVAKKVGRNRDRRGKRLVDVGEKGHAKKASWKRGV